MMDDVYGVVNDFLPRSNEKLSGRKRMKSQIVKTAKGSIEYTLLGKGPLVLVCHGTSSDCYASELAGPLVDSGFSVLTPSRPGYGQTPLDVGKTAAQAGEALAALLD